MTTTLAKEHIVSTQTTSGTSDSSRRTFLKQSSGAAGAAALASTIASRVYAAGSDTVKIALIGCGGRGTGAAGDAMNTKGPTKLWAVADIFPDRMASSLGGLSKRFKEKVEVPAERQFIGFDAYKKAIDCLDKDDVVILATPPAFRPIHFEYAVQKGRNVFMEKSFAVDPPGVRRVLAAAKLSVEKGLKVAGGLMWRHDLGREAVIKKIHDGDIGDVVLLRTYRMHGPVGLGARRPGESELAHQIRNYNAFTWVNGSFILDWMIHNLDICCWAKNALPIAAQGHGGRASRALADQVFDHYAIEYTFPDGTRLLAQGRHIDKCHNSFADYAHGSKGSAIIMPENALGAAQPRIYKNHVQTTENEVWRYQGPQPNPYQVEHDLLFDAIRNDKPYNEGERCAYAAMTGILGRMAAESGQYIKWDDALKSNVALATGLENMTMESKAPVEPDAQGQYPIARPGYTKVI